MKLPDAGLWLALFVAPLIAQASTLRVRKDASPAVRSARRLSAFTFSFITSASRFLVRARSEFSPSISSSLALVMPSRRSLVPETRSSPSSAAANRSVAAFRSLASFADLSPASRRAASASS